LEKVSIIKENKLNGYFMLKRKQMKKWLILLLLGLGFLYYYVVIYSAKYKENFMEPVEANQTTYTLEGVKDKRLDAYFEASYMSTNMDACSQKHLQTGRRRPSFTSRWAWAEDGNYSIKFPIFLTKKTKQSYGKCIYKFQKLDLVISRKDEKYFSSIYPILTDRNTSDPTYMKTDGGDIGPGKSYPGDKEGETPPDFYTDKKYFQIAKETTFLCRTWYMERRDSSKSYSQFHCVMKIGDGKIENPFIYNPKLCSATHPKFGVDEIKSTTLHIDIYADDNGSNALLLKYKGKDAYDNEGYYRGKEWMITSYPFQEYDRGKEFIKRLFK